MLLGYSTYFTTIIRSNADPAVDMYNVDNPVSLVGYLSVTSMVTGPSSTAPTSPTARPASTAAPST